jgi:nitrogen regulation protein NR(I)
MKTILIADDEPNVRYSFKKLFRSGEYHILEAANGKEAVDLLAQQVPDLIVMDIEMPVMGGLEAIRKVKAIAPQVPVLIVTAYGTTERVIEAMRYGAYEYLEKPFDVTRLKSLISEALQAGAPGAPEETPEAGRRSDGDQDAIIGNSPALTEVFKTIGRVAGSDVSVLVVGESGTGKELVAKAIHRYSERSGMPFIAINCAAIPDNLLESELFGFEKGSFTSAHASRPGKFELAHKGTIFLDEIGDMSFSLQAKLLRVLQGGTFERIGGNKSTKVDVRVIAATNKNLEEAIARREFREDLYYRLKVITITLPPLRMRREDIPELARHFLSRYGMEYGKPNLTLNSEALETLANYTWPGNIRELENIIKQLVLLSKSAVIGADLIAGNLREPAAEIYTAGGVRFSGFQIDDPEAYDGVLYKIVIEHTERELLRLALRHTRGNQARAARLLGVSRVMLHERIDKYGLREEPPAEGQ